jgi:LPS-assembly protein
VTILAALVAGLLAQAAPLASVPPSLAGDVTVSADRVSYEGGTGRVRLEGHAAVRRGAVTLRARSATYDPETGEVLAQGDVLLTDPTRAVSAYAVRAVLGGEVEAQGVVAFVKDRPVDLSGLQSAEEVRRTGRNRLSFSGDRLSGTADRLRVGGARLTLCDCGAAPPSWEVDAREADVIPGKRAILRGAVVRVTPVFTETQVPVLWLPWLYVPLGERQSGLLLPTYTHSTSGGESFAQPLYLTLGRSADLTLTPEYFFGRHRKDLDPNNQAISGPGARLEVRWTPAVGAEGRIEGAWLDDASYEPRGARGNRWGVVGDHVQSFGATELQASLRLAGDGVWLRDTSNDELVRDTPYRRSNVLVTHRTDAVVAEVGGAYDEPLLPSLNGSAGGYEPGVRWGTLGSGRQVGSRLGAGTVTLLPSALGPLRLSGRVGATRFGSVEGARDLEGRPSMGRADGRFELSLPLLVGGIVTVAPYVRGAGVAYSFDVGERPAAEGWGVAGAVVQTEVSRRFGDLRHLIAPRIEWRGGSDAYGHRLAYRAYDPFDRTSVGLLSAAAGPFQQLRLSVASRLEGPQRTLLSAEVGQDADLRAGRWSEAFAKLGAGVGPLGADASARFYPIDPRPGTAPPSQIPSKLDRLSELQANLALQDRRGDAFKVGFLSVGPGGSSALVTGLDPLFDARALGIDPGASATVGLRAALGPARVGYDAVLPGRATMVGSCVDSTAQRRVEPMQVQQHTATLGWESPCHCFNFTAHLAMNDCRSLTYGFSLDLSRAMAAGTAAAR